MNLEQKLLRMQEILQLLELKKVSLSESMPLLKEANELRQQIIKELSEMENQITTLDESNQNNREQE